MSGWLPPGEARGGRGYPLAARVTSSIRFVTCSGRKLYVSHGLLWSLGGYELRIWLKCVSRAPSCNRRGSCSPPFESSMIRLAIIKLAASSRLKPAARNAPSKAIATGPSKALATTLLSFGTDDRSLSAGGCARHFRTAIVRASEVARSANWQLCANNSHRAFKSRRSALMRLSRASCAFAAQSLARSWQYAASADIVCGMGGPTHCCW